MQTQIRVTMDFSTPALLLLDIQMFVSDVALDFMIYSYIHVNSLTYIDNTSKVIGSASYITQRLDCLDSRFKKLFYFCNGCMKQNTYTCDYVWLGDVASSYTK